MMIGNNENGKNVIFGILGKLGLEGPKRGPLGFRAHLGKIGRKRKSVKLHVKTINTVMDIG